MISLHSHSGQFCCHAEGTLRQVVESAIDKGFTHYGLSEHMPRFREQDLYPEEKHLSLQQLEDMFASFVIEARKLQIEYADRICLLVGMETEFITDDMATEILSLRKRYALDFVIGSLHHVCDGIPIDFDEKGYEDGVRVCGSTEALFLEYFDRQYRMLTSVQPDIVGHFDLVRIFRPNYIPLSKTVWERVRRNVAYVIEYGGLFEVNSRAYKKGLLDAYPYRDILKHILDLGGRVCLSDDSHGPKDVGMHYRKLRDYIVRMGVDQVWTLEWDGCKCVQRRIPFDDIIWPAQ